MSQRILIVGGVAGGASVAARARRIDEASEIIMFERGPHVSFSNCALPYHLSGIVADSDSLVLMSPEQFKAQYNIIAQTNSEVVSINREAKTIQVKNVITGEIVDEAYDKLVLSPGAKPIKPQSIQGVNSDHVFTVRNVVDIKNVQSYIDAHDVKTVSVIGGGFIGVEVAENLQMAGKKVHLIEAIDQIMSPFDADMAQILHKEMMDHGINLVLSDGIKAITETQVELASGKILESDMVVMAIGVMPETSLAVASGIELGETGSIAVDHNYLTNDKNIYAVGDAIEVHHKLTNKKTRLALAGPAQRQARAAADHMFGIPHQNKGVIGSSVVQVFDLAAASTGLNEKMAQKEEFNYDVVYIIPGDMVGLMPEANPMHFKLVFEVPTGRILGAQAIGKGNVDKRIDVIATMITMNGTLEDLKELELCYAPPFGTAKDVVNFAALVGLNLLHKNHSQVRVSEVRGLVESGAFIVDVREPHEYEKGSLTSSVNIPLSQIRERMNEIPHDVPVYLHCRSGQRSYNAVMALQNSGYNNVVNISGSFLGICLHEYFKDQVSGRDKIVTEYNFN